MSFGLKNPISLSIGQPHFDVPKSIQKAAKMAIDDRRIKIQIRTSI